MSESNVSYFDLRARRQRRDQLVEDAFKSLSELQQIVETDADHIAAHQAAQAVKNLRTPEKVAELEHHRMTRILKGG